MLPTKLLSYQCERTSAQLTHLRVESACLHRTAAAKVFQDGTRLQYKVDLPVAVVAGDWKFGVMLDDEIGVPWPVVGGELGPQGRRSSFRGLSPANLLENVRGSLAPEQTNADFSRHERQACARKKHVVRHIPIRLSSFNADPDI